MAGRQYDQTIEQELSDITASRQATGHVPQGCPTSSRSGRRGPARCRLPSRAAPTTFTPVAKVKERRRGATTISSKHQITIPTAELRAAGLEAGERLVARADGPGRVILEREHDVLADFAGALTGVYADHGIDTLRGEWD